MAICSMSGWLDGAPRAVAPPARQPPAACMCGAGGGERRLACPPPALQRALYSGRCFSSARIWSPSFSCKMEGSRMRDVIHHAATERRVAAAASGHGRGAARRAFDQCGGRVRRRLQCMAGAVGARRSGDGRDESSDLAKRSPARPATLTSNRWSTSEPSTTADRSSSGFPAISKLS